ncbi:hypothetical protein [Mycolicibacterium wolinskyi]|uniref:hypothetical protein n=1 Tax=Mycolicibacterium wolinskyi TaxID=59750 RepID=UPI003917AF8F
MSSAAGLSDNQIAEESTPPVPAWTPLQKLAFRLLFTIGGGIVVLSVYGNLGLGVLWKPLLDALAHLGERVAGGSGATLTLSGSGDSLATWYFHLGWILMALAITAVWTALDKQRPNYRSLAALLLVVARFALAVSMLLYGLAKVIPAQMGYMALPAYQIQLVGDVSLMNTLWGFMGASAPYSIAAGLVEFVSGVLLLWRRTWLMGALLAIVAMGQVFLLNLFYDVPVKQISGQLLLIAIGITAPYWRSLAAMLLQRGPVEPVTLWAPLGSGTRWVRRTGTVTKWVLAGAFIALTTTFSIVALHYMHERKSEIDGVWRTTSFTIDGRQATLQDTAPEPWINVAITYRASDFRSIVTQNAAGYVTSHEFEIDDDRIELKHPGRAEPIVLYYRQDAPDRLVLTGMLDGKRIEGQFERRFLQKSNSHFRFVQPDVEPGFAGRLP